MALLITCECSQRIEAADDQAGQQVPCPACGRTVQLPDAYNPLSTTKYVSAGATSELAELPRPAGPECVACAGSGLCTACGGRGQLRRSFLDGITDAISGAASGLAGFFAGALGTDPHPRKFVTRSEKRRANACPKCEGNGKCFTCEGSGHASP